VSVQAQYADLAENYTADADYEPATVVVFGGDQEITTTNVYADTRVAGVISSNPAYLMNAAGSGLHAFQLQPKGAAFELTKTEKIVGNFLPTGIDFGPDGAMYMADWVNGWNDKGYGRIWKMTDETAKGWALQQQTAAEIKADYTKLGKVYYKDFNVEIQKKVSKPLTFTLFYANFVYNKDVAQGKVNEGFVYANIEVLEFTYKFNDKHALRMELQGLQTRQDMGDWATIVAEYTISPNWFFSTVFSI
jgi:hypothetical protein